MSRSITIVFILLIIIIAGFAFLNYNRLTQMKSDLLKREELLDESERLLKEQETSISELAEKMQEVLGKQELPQHERIASDIEGELQGLQLKVDELVQMRKSDTVDIVLLGEEKAKLEILLSEREYQWQEKEEENKRIISSLQNEIQKYELESKSINEKILDIQGYLASEQAQRKELEQDLTKFEETIERLQGQLALKQDDEKYVQQISELLSTTQELKEEISKKNSSLGQFQKEYQEIVEQLNAYQQHVEELKKELAIAKEIEDTLWKEQLAKIERERRALERLLSDKQLIWDKQNEENRQLISYLKERLEVYQEEVETVKIDTSLFKEGIAAQIELQQQNLSLIKEREEQISMLTSQIEQYTGMIENYEKTVAGIRAKFQEEKDISLQEQQALLDTTHSLIEERDESQKNIVQLHGQISRLEAEIAEIEHRIGQLAEKEEAGYYEVKSGDNLWNIARGKYQEGIAWTKIFKANQDQIQNPDLIYPYQQFIIPD